MVKKIAFELIVIDKVVFNIEADTVVVPGTSGDLGVLYGHTPFISTLRPGVIEVHNDGKVEQRLFIRSGFASIIQENISVLADEVEDMGQINLDTVVKSLQDLRQQKTDLEDNSGQEALDQKINDLVVKKTYLEYIS